MAALPALLQAEGIMPPDPPSTEGGKRNLVQDNSREPSSKRARFEYVKQELRMNTNGPDSDGEVAEIEVRHVSLLSRVVVIMRS